MNYSRTQKWLSSFLIFSILFLQTFEVPMLSSTKAEAKVNADVVSFIVDDTLYSGAVKSRVLQYANDVQAYLPNTRVVIFPVQKTANPFTIASINEKLFYEGDGQGLSRIVGTVLIGDVPLPVVHKDGKAFMSVYPYVDFDNKSFVYDQAKNSYEYTTKILTDEKPEIWHSVIRPNTGDAVKNNNELITFFNKTHDFYNKQGLFSPENTRAEPRVFYMDTFHDQEASSPDIWKSYNLYLDNVEDITYRRFNKYLAKKLYDASQGFYSLNSASVTDPAIKSILDAYSGSTMDISKAPDITTKDIIEKSVKQFFEVFNAKYMGDILRYVHNTGRYGDTDVRADSVPVVIAKKDLFMRTTLKDANTALEGVIDTLLRNKLSEPLKIATSYRISTTTSTEGSGATPATSSNVATLYKNYFFGQEASTISDSKQCTIVRGSTLKVEENRGYNIKNAEGDANILSSDLPSGRCFPGGTPATLSYWGGNSILNLDQSKMQASGLTLGSHTYTNFVKSIYDIAGSRELDKDSPLHIATPLDCLESNLLLQPYSYTTSGTDSQSKTIYWPAEKGSALQFSCITSHKTLPTSSNYYTYSNSFPAESCTISKLELDGKVVTQSGTVCTGKKVVNHEKTYSFKTLSGSIMEHKSPTDEEYGIELGEMITPSLASDRDRYVDYLDKNIDYQKIVYPNFFRITLDRTELNYSGATSKIKDLLDTKTAEITALGGDINLYQILSSDEKALNAVIESVIWNNMKNATLKYSSTLERGLNIDGEKKISANDTKNDYEIAYLGAPGDAKNMYLKVDPEAKSPLSSEVSNIMDQVNNYHGLIDGTNIANADIGNASVFKCGPPEGVPLQEWLPAIFCWLGTILPPTISAGSCGGNSNKAGSSTNAPSVFATPANALDANGNGVLDGYELIGSSTGELKLLNPEKVFGYGETVPLEAQLTKDGKIITIDSFNVVSFDIQKLSVSSLNAGIIGKQIMYDRAGNGDIANILNIAPYINFIPQEIRAQNGLASYSFSSKSEDIDVVFSVHILTKDRYGNVIVDKKSAPVTYSVRSERISVQSKIKNGDSLFTSSSVIEAGNPNGILFNLNKINKDTLVLSENLPYTLRVYDDISNTLVRDPINVSKNEYLFRDSELLSKSGVYRFEFIDRGGIKGFTTITVLPALPVKIEVTPSSNTFIVGEKTTVLVRILDSFGNLAQGEVYKLTGSISGGAEFIDADGKKLGITTSKNVIQGYASFDVTNASISDAMNLSFRIDRVNVSSDAVILTSIDFAKVSVEVENREHIVAGKEKHKVNIKVLDRNNQILSGYNGVLSLDFPKLSGTMNTPFIHIAKGVSETEITLTPGYVAEKNLHIQAQIPGVNTVEGDVVTILPDVPMSFAFVKKDDRIEAREGNLNNTRATLYDRYGNVAYNAIGYNLTLHIPIESQKYASLSKTEYSFSGGMLDFDIAATTLPGKAYIIGTVTPGLESNSFTITDKSNKTLTITGVSENLTVLDTYYLFNKSKIDTLRYDAQYSVLLGGEYGDVTVGGYLGGEIIFNHDSKSLAVTTLLNNPWKEQDLFGFTPAGKYTYIAGTDNTKSLQTTLGDNQEKSYIAFYDSYRKEYIARAWLNIDPSVTSYLPCTGTGNDITNCSIATQTTIFMKGFGGNSVVVENGGLRLSSSSNIPLLRMSPSGKMEKYPGIDLELDEKTNSNLLGVKIVSNGAQIGYLGIKFASDFITTVPSSGLDTALQMNKNALVLETLSSRYIPHKTHLGVSSLGSEGIMFAFKDVTTNEIGILDAAYMAKSGPTGLEAYPKQTGIGWEGTNRMLLEVAAGTTIGNATKFYQTFSTITLGDAVSHLPRVSTTSNFDQTIGTQISVGNGEQIESYQKIDANGDGVPDMVIFYESGKIQLLMNYGGSFKDMGYLAYVSDGGKGRKGVGNFFGDGYDDIVLTDAKGKLIVLDNVQGKFTRTSPIIVNESGATDSVHGFIQQLEIFDMDADGKTDIITLDDSGEINILYGTVREVAGVQQYIFTKKLIESSLGMRLSTVVRNDGGAFSYTGLVLPIASTNTPNGVNQAMIDNLIYYQYNYQSDSKGVALTSTVSLMLANTAAIAGSGNTDFSALANSDRGTKRTFVRSPFAEGKGLKVEKTYKILSSSPRDTMQTGDKIRVEIALTNTSTKAFRDAVYLDSNDRKIFLEDQSGIYTMVRNGGAEEQHPLKYLTAGDFDYGFDFASIAPGETIKIQYLMTAIPAAFGVMGVGLLEKGEAGDDIYGDISLSPNNICGGDLMMWRSVEPYLRSYQKGSKTFVDNSVLPDSLAQNAIDLNKNGIPDYIDTLIASGKGDASLLKTYSNTQLAQYSANAINNSTSKGSNVLSYNASKGSIEIGGLSSGNVEAINGQIDDIVKGLGCGFGGGSCINSPLNWAPLAPGSTLTAFGFPLGDMSPSTGLPVFSAMTGIPLYGPWGCIAIPAVWPLSPIGYENTCGSNLPNAGGVLGTSSTANFFRLYITPTITGAVGMAACFGGNAGQVGKLPPKGISPLIPGGNCIVAAQPLSSCKGGGSDGNAGSLGLGMNSNNASVNANACIKPSGNTILLPEDRRNLISYVAGDNAHLPEISASMARGNLSGLSSGPLIGIGLGGGGESNFEVSLDTKALKDFDFGNILKIKNSRVAAFPDFLMDWATRQLEEIVNKLTSLPTLYIILPDFSGFDISGYGEIFDKFSEGKSSDGKDYTASMGSNSLVTDNADTINSLGKNVSGIKAAYEFMSHLPLIKLQTEMVDIAIPWLSFEEMDKWLINAKLTMKQWKGELADKQGKWSRIGNLSEADKKVMVRTEGLIGSLQENIQIIEEYKRFPEKLQKYLTWKERYASQILCNIEAIEQMMGGWIGDNGKRFRTWVELYILIKAILKSWQLIVDLFYGYEAECSVCRNERYDLKHFMLKLISAIIPQIPVVQFPKWPDIWLDLHNIRGGLRILMPEFHFNFVPIILPELPRLFLPDVPTIGIGLPSLPILPRLPELPNLPDLPSLPNIKLPDLPPPPTIPKLFGGIAAVLDIFKIVAKILCIMRINPFVPEWRAGDQIAQITERQGTMPGLDFLNVEFPNFPLSFIDAIKVTTFVNLEFDIDFIVAMSKATLNPLNQFTNDLSNIGSIVVPDINLRDAIPQHIETNIGPQGYAPKKKATKDQIMAVLLQKFSFDVLHNFMALNIYMDKHSKEEVTVQGLKDILTENIGTIRGLHDLKALAIADTLQQAVTYKGEAEDIFIQDLKNQNTQKFRLIKDYITGEKMETVRLKTEMDTMLRTGTMSKETTPSLISIGRENIKVQAISTDTGFGDNLKQRILATNTRILPSLERIKNGGGAGLDKEVPEIQNMGNSLVTGIESSLSSFTRDTKRNDSIHMLAYEGSMNTLLSLNTDSSSPTTTSTTSPSTNASSTASSYKYEGIYILDKNNKQVRLFNYIDGVDGKESLVYIDVNKSGNNDIIYRMDNSLYLKQNFLNTAPVSHSSSSPKAISWQDFLPTNSETSRVLAAPNHFEETFIASNEIDFSFRPANPLQDNFFRFEYYDYIDRFDKINSGEDPLSVSPKTAIHKVDLIPELQSETVFDTTHTGFVGRHNILSFGRATGEATVTMNIYQVVTPETNGTNPIIIAEGRTVYTDVGGATISYIRDGETVIQTLSLDRNTNYEFLTNTNIWVKSGNLYLFKEAQEQKKLNVGDLYGMPIPPKTKVELSGNNFVSFSYYDGSSMRLDGPGTYEYYPLGKKSQEYSVSISAPNDWYYAKIYSFDKGINSTMVSLHLLSPQKSADTEGPLITYGDVIRIPVYQKQVLSLATYVADISGVENLWIDSDLTKDTDGDGDTKNDKDSLDIATPYGIKKGNSLLDLNIGPFDTLFTKKIQLFTKDGNGNISSKDLTLTVYPPVPEIQSLSGTTVYGTLNEILGNEPIDIFRIRNSTLIRIEPTQSDSIKTTENGTFALSAKNMNGIALTESGKTIALIDERTGKIALEDTSFQVNAVPANKDGPLQIQVLDINKKVIFAEKIHISPVSNIEQTSNFDQITGTGIFVSPTTGFTFVKNTLSSPSLPGGGYIADGNSKAVAGISKGGDIYILDTKYELSYAIKDSYILLRLLDPTKNPIANILYKISAEYVIK